jgi:hypothetical protein
MSDSLPFDSKLADMESQLHLEIQPQPDATTCGPTCLQAVYRYYGDELSLQTVIAETGRLDEGGTLAVLLGCDALRRGYRATIYTNNLQVFDPTWFGSTAVDLKERLRAQDEAKRVPRLHVATEAYLEFLDRGGKLSFEDLTPSLIRKYLRRGIPILSGLSATFLYRSARERSDNEFDDVRGEPVGHFVLLAGYHPESKQVLVADPLLPNPMADGHRYLVRIDRVVAAILLGVVTYDANLLIIDATRKRKQ